MRPPKKSIQVSLRGTEWFRGKAEANSETRPLVVLGAGSAISSENEIATLLIVARNDKKEGFSVISNKRKKGGKAYFNHNL